MSGTEGVLLNNRDTHSHIQLLHPYDNDRTLDQTRYFSSYTIPYNSPISVHDP